MTARLAIVAGGGELPARLAAACRRRNRPYFILALEGFADPGGVAGEPHAWVRLGAAQAMLDTLRREGCAEIVMAGRLRRPTWSELRPDLLAARVLMRAGWGALGDDGVLRSIVRALEAEGLRVVGAHEVLDDLLAAPGRIAGPAPDATAEADIARGFAVARALGAADVGQAVVVQQGLVLGVEAIEGTDALLARCAALRRDGPGGVLVKCSKPGQERRADLPTIGPPTIANARAAGLRGIAVEAGATLVIDAGALAAAAEAAGLFVVARTPP